MDQATCRIMTETPIAATASAHGNPISAPPTPAMTTSEDSASERECQALAASRRDPSLRAARMVYQ